MGRKKIDNPKLRLNTRAREEHIIMCDDLGRGNISLGLEIILEFAKLKIKDVEKFAIKKGKYDGLDSK